MPYLLVNLDATLLSLLFNTNRAVRMCLALLSNVIITWYLCLRGLYSVKVSPKKKGFGAVSRRNPRAHWCIVLQVPDFGPREARRRLALASRIPAHSHIPSTEFSPLLVYSHFLSSIFLLSLTAPLYLTYPLHLPLMRSTPLVSNAMCPVHSCPCLVVPTPLLFHLPSLMIHYA